MKLKEILAKLDDKSRAKVLKIIKAEEKSYPLVELRDALYPVKDSIDELVSLKIPQLKKVGQDAMKLIKAIEKLNKYL